MLFKQGSFVTPEEVEELKDTLEKIAENFPGFSPMISCRHSKTRSGNLVTNVQMPLFTDCYSGTGLKITSNGNIGISKIVFFTNFFKNVVEDRINTSLEPLGNIYNKKSIKDVWERYLELRLAQGKVINDNYGYYVGWKSIDEVT